MCPGRLVIQRGVEEEVAVGAGVGLDPSGKLDGALPALALCP